MKNSKYHLYGQAALITGAAKRLGREMALALAGEGVNIVIHYHHSAEDAMALHEDLSSRGVKSWLLKADLGKKEEYEALIRNARESAGKIDILINSASIFPAETLQQMSFESLCRNVQINAWVPFFLSREFAEEAGTGKIINILDTRILDIDGRHAAYHLSKVMLAEITRMMAMELAPRISVNAVAPGLILPPEGHDETYLEALKDSVPLKMYGNPSHITDAVLYLLKSEYTTGQVLYVDGGRHLKGIEVC